MNTSEVLNTAADLIEERGWVGWQEQMDDADLDPWAKYGNGPVCIEGAIMAAAGLEWTHEASRCQAGLAVRAHLAERLTSPHLFVFNDAPGRTAAEVIEVLRAAALIEAAKERADVHEVVA